MALTKPAGCFLQLLAVPLLAGGCVTLLPGDSGTATVGQIVLGLALIAAGAILLVIGRRPAVRK